MISYFSASAQYYGSNEWANDMLMYTNMNMYISTNQVLNQQMIKAYTGTDASDREYVNKKKALANVKPVLFEPTSKKLFLEKMKATTGKTEQAKQAFISYGQLFDKAMESYKQLVTNYKQDTRDLGLAMAFFIEVTHYLSTGSHLEDQHVLDMSKESNS